MSAAGSLIKEHSMIQGFLYLHWRVAALGGGAVYGATAGVACWTLSDDSAYDGAHIGGRLSF